MISDPRARKTSSTARCKSWSAGEMMQTWDPISIAISSFPGNRPCAIHHDIGARDGGLRCQKHDEIAYLVRTDKSLNRHRVEPFILECWVGALHVLGLNEPWTDRIDREGRC